MIAPEPFFEPRGTPFSVLGRLKALSHLGHEVDLLTYHVGQNVVLPGVKILRTPSMPFLKEVPIGPSLRKLFLDIFIFARAYRLLQEGDYDLLHTHEEASFLGSLLTRRFGIRHLYDMHSSLPQQLKNFQHTNYRVFIRLFEWLERQAINSSDALITICPALREYVRQINSHVPQMMIENMASESVTEAVSDENVQTFKAAHALNGKKIVLYAGTFEPYQGLDLLVASAQWVLRKRKDVMFLLVGGKPDQVQHYQGWVRQLGLSSHFHFTGTRPPEEVSMFVKLSHTLVSPRISGTNTPLKVYAYLQSSKPIVATNLYTHTQVLSPDMAVLVEPDSDALARGILAVLGDATLARRLSRRARELFENRYSFQTFVQKTQQVLQMALR